jgi:lysozyme family protein
MANFQPAFNITMGNEGGYANNVHDSGGETWRGIARNFWPKWSGWPIVDQVKSTNPANLNQALFANAQLNTMVEEFYQQNFWNPVGLPTLNCQQMANQLFDIAVNMGTGIACKMLQQAVNTITPNAVTVDGAVGPVTINAANAQNEEALYNAICSLRKKRYESIIAANPSQAVFQKSWFSRITPWKSAAETTA